MTLSQKPISRLEHFCFLLVFLLVWIGLSVGWFSVFGLFFFFFCKLLISSRSSGRRLGLSYRSWPKFTGPDLVEGVGVGLGEWGGGGAL